MANGLPEGYFVFMSQDKLQIIDDLVTQEQFCVLATSNGIQPLTSLMTFFADHAAMKFYFLSRRDSQKTKNLKKHPHVSILLDKRNENIALTIQGVYSPIRKEQTVDAITKIFIKKYPYLSEFANDSNTELIRIEARTADLVEGVEQKFSTKFTKN